jgi:hypothetical protein
MSECYFTRTISRIGTRLVNNSEKTSALLRCSNNPGCAMMEH